MLFGLIRPLQRSEIMAFHLCIEHDVVCGGLLRAGGPQSY